MRQLLVTVIAMMLAMALATPVAADTSVVVRGTATFPDDLTAVQAAVDTASKVILEGIFDFGDGTLVIDRDMTLRGRHAATILNGGELETESPAILAIAPATKVTIRDLTMDGSAYAAILTDGVRADIRSNRIALGPERERGVAVRNGDGSRVRGNTINDAPNAPLELELLGIEAAFSSSVDVRNNIVESRETGILLFDVSDSTVVKNTIEAQDVGIGLIGVSDSTFVNNAVTIIGSGTGAFDVGATGVFLIPGFDPTMKNTGNRIRKTSLAGEMVYGYLFGEASLDNKAFIAPRNLDKATFVAPPFFGLCDNGPGDSNEGGATVIFVGATNFGPAAEGNTIHNRARSATFLDCGIDNVVR